MNSLVAAHWPKAKAPQFAKADVENRYYQSHAPRRRRLIPLVPIAAVVGIVALILDATAR
jgi:hypothetical protein